MVVPNQTHGKLVIEPSQTAQAAAFFAKKRKDVSVCSDELRRVSLEIAAAEGVPRVWLHSHLVSVPIELFQCMIF